MGFYRREASVAARRTAIFKQAISQPAARQWKQRFMADIHSIMNPVEPEEPVVPKVEPSVEPNVESSLEPEQTSVTQLTIIDSFDRIKTHFPAARIKKIMQSDEEIGKVAQATPVVVGRALEIFIANLVEVSALEAKKSGVRRIGAAHIRAAVEKTEQFDFLVDAVAKYQS